MKIVRLFLNIACIAALAMTAVAQNKGSKASDCRQEGGEVERKDNRFTGESTVMLKPQVITTDAPGQELKMALSYQIKPEVRGREQSIIPEMVNIIFTSKAGKLIYARELELVFLIDGERVHRVPAISGDNLSHITTLKDLTQTVPLLRA